MLSEMSNPTKLPNFAGFFFFFFFFYGFLEEPFYEMVCNNEEQLI